MQETQDFSRFSKNLHPTKTKKKLSLLKDKSFVTGLFLVLSKFAVNDNFPY